MKLIIKDSINELEASYQSDMLDILTMYSKQELTPEQTSVALIECDRFWALIVGVK